MSRTQVNFRIDEDLLEQIKEKASLEGIPYTAWIVKQCQIGLGNLSPTERQPSSSLSSETVKQLIDDTIQERLDDAIREALPIAIASLKSEIQTTDKKIEFHVPHLNKAIASLREELQPLLDAQEEAVIMREKSIA